MKIASLSRIMISIGAAGGALLRPMEGRSMTVVVISGAVTMKITSSTSITSMGMTLI
jgi:hypothetical protein